GRLGGVLCGGGGVDFGRRVGFCRVELRRQFRGLGGGLLLALLGLRLGLVHFRRSERLVERSIGGGQRGVGAPLDLLQSAQRRRERFRFARRCHGGFLRLGGRLDGRGGLSGERLGLGRRGGDGLRLRHEQCRVGKRDRGRVVRRDD